MKTKRADNGIQTLAIVPARKGSKGIREKNIAMLDRRPLLSYTIEAALEAELIDRVIVSTDSPKIAEIAGQCGAEVPFLRPASLGGDWVPLPEVLEHAVGFLEQQEGITAGPIVTLLPTNPLRNSQHIDQALELFLREDADALNSMHPVNEHPEDLFLRDFSNGRPRFSFPFGENRESRCDSRLLVANGAVNIVSRERLRLVSRKRFEELTGRKVIGFVTSPLAGLDINTPEDLEIAEAIIQYLERNGASPHPP